MMSILKSQYFFFHLPFFGAVLTGLNSESIQQTLPPDNLSLGLKKRKEMGKKKFQEANHKLFPFSRASLHLIDLIFVIKITEKRLRFMQG